MSRPIGLVGLALIALGGCLPIQTNNEQSDLLQVPTSPFPPPVVQTSLRAPLNTAPAAQDIAWRVDAVGRKLVEANAQIGLKPRFVALGAANPDICHRDLSTVYISELLVRRCQSESELAAVLAGELGRMVAERESTTPRETRAPDPRLPMALPIGSQGNAWNADPAYFLEIAKYEKEYPRSAHAKPLPPPDAAHVAGVILERAGFRPSDLELAPRPVQPTQLPGAWRP